MLIVDLLRELDGLSEPEQNELLRGVFDGDDAWRIALFGQYFFPHLIWGDDEIPEFHAELLFWLSNPGHAAMLEPRGFSKTTWAKIKVIHRAIYPKYGKPEFFVWIGDTQTSAEAALGGIRSELEGNDKLMAVYGRFTAGEKWEKWTERLVITKDKTIFLARGRAKGRGLNILNRRPTFIVGDDLEDDEAVCNPRLRQKTLKWIDQVVLPALEPVTGQLKIIGTYLHQAAVIGILQKRYGGPVRAAIEDGKSIWPQRFPLDYLLRLKEDIGTVAFATEMLNDPLDPTATTLNPAWVEQGMCRPIEATFWEIAIHIDPKAGEKRTSDKWVITVVGRPDKSNHRYVLMQKVGSEPSPIAQAKHLITAYREFNRGKNSIRSLTVEVVLNQTSVWQTIQDWKAHRLDFSTADEPFDEKDRNIPIAQFSPNGKDKLARRQLFDPDFERGEIHLLPEMRDCKDQLCSLGMGTLDHDDMADSLVAALECLGRVETPNAPEPEPEPPQQTVAGNVMEKIY